MANKKRNRENAFRISKEKDEKEYLIFTEVFKLPFNVRRSFSDMIPNNYIYAEDLKAKYNVSLIHLPNNLENNVYVKLIEKICSILNGEVVKFNLKNVRFNYKDSDSLLIYINNDPFLRIISEEAIKDYMESNNIRGYRSAKTIRRSLMYYIVKKLNESLI